jgi:hypothetical protein
VSAGSGPDLIAGRYRPVARLVAIGGVDRHLAIDTDSETQVEVIVFTRHGAVPAAFGDMARHLHAAPHASLAPILAWTEPGADASLDALLVQPRLEGARLTGAVVLPRGVALAAGADIAEALATLHHAGLVHGDVGAAAVVLDTQGRAVLLGAGARALQAAAVGGIVVDSDRDDDMRGLGRLLYTLVCGTEPTRPLVAPLLHAADISPALNGLLLSLLSDDPERPPPSAAVVAPRLRALAAEEGLLPPGDAVLGNEPSVPVEPPPPGRGSSDALMIAGAAALCLFGVAAAFALSRTGKPAATITITSSAIVTPSSSGFQPSTESVISPVVPAPATSAPTTTPSVVPPVNSLTPTTTALTTSTPLLPIPPISSTPTVGSTGTNGVGAAGAATVVTDAVVTFNAFTGRGLKTFTETVTATGSGASTVTTVTVTVNASTYPRTIVTYTQPVTVTIPR